MSYAELRAQLAEMYGWTFAVIDDMSFEQIESAWTGGRKSKGIPATSPEQVRSLARNWRRIMGI